MSRARFLQSVVFLFCISLAAEAQSNRSPNRSDPRSAEDQPVNLPSAQHQVRPKLSLQDALRIAEAYIDEQRIDTSSFWLYRANFILLGDERTPIEKKVPCWHFEWVNDNAILGDYVEILVTMDGKPSRAPSM